MAEHWCFAEVEASYRLIPVILSIAIYFNRRLNRFLFALSLPLLFFPLDSADAALLAQREELIRFPNSVQFKDRKVAVRSVVYVVTFPVYYTPLAPVFKHERRVQIKIRDQVQELLAKGDYKLIHCEAGALVLRRVPDRVPGQKTTSGISSHCDALD